jgi:hypothetical protein
MQPLTASDYPHPVRGRWIWRLSGVLSIALIAALVGLGLAQAGRTDGGDFTAVPSRVITVPGTVTSLSVSSYGAAIRVVRGATDQVRVIEEISFPRASGPPSVTERVSHGRLTLAAPSCQNRGCSVGFRVTVPSGVTVLASSEGGPVSVSGVAQADLNSGGGPATASAIQGLLTVRAEGGSITATDTGSARLDSGGGPIVASGVSGPLTASAEGGSITVTDAGTSHLDSGGGPVTVGGVSGPLSAITDGGSLQIARLSDALTADTGGGQVSASGLAAPTARITTDGGEASVTFTSAPRSVQLTTGGGPIDLALPGGPYAVTADASGGDQEVTVPTSPTADRTISASSDGGDLLITRSHPLADHADGGQRRATGRVSPW